MLEVKTIPSPYQKPWIQAKKHVLCNWSKLNVVRTTASHKKQNKPHWFLLPWHLALTNHKARVFSPWLEALGKAIVLPLQTHKNKLEIIKLEEEIAANEAKIKENEEIEKRFLAYDNPTYKKPNESNTSEEDLDTEKVTAVNDENFESIEMKKHL